MAARYDNCYHFVRELDDNIAFLNIARIGPMISIGGALYLSDAQKFIEKILEKK